MGTSPNLASSCWHGKTWGGRIDGLVFKARYGYKSIWLLATLGTLKICSWGKRRWQGSRRKNIHIQIRMTGSIVGVNQAEGRDAIRIREKKQVIYAI